jgi:hypothetical protein
MLDATQESTLTSIPASTQMSALTSLPATQMSALMSLPATQMLALTSLPASSQTSLPASTQASQVASSSQAVPSTSLDSEDESKQTILVHPMFQLTHIIHSVPRTPSTSARRGRKPQTRGAASTRGQKRSALHRRLQRQSLRMRLRSGPSTLPPSLRPARDRLPPPSCSSGPCSFGLPSCVPFLLSLAASVAAPNVFRLLCNCIPIIMSCCTYDTNTTTKSSSLV